MRKLKKIIKKYSTTQVKSIIFRNCFDFIKQQIKILKSSSQNEDKINLFYIKNLELHLMLEAFFLKDYMDKRIDISILLNEFLNTSDFNLALLLDELKDSDGLIRNRIKLKSVRHRPTSEILRKYDK